MTGSSYRQLRPPEQLYETLVAARWTIEQAIEDMYQKLARDPTLTVRRGSVWVMRLTDDESKAITPAGLVFDSLKQEDRGVYTNWLDVRPRFWPYAEAVWEAGLRPEGRRSDKVRPMNGFCLLVYLKGSR